MPKTKRVFKGNSNSQDAHEAIRPSNVYISPKKIRKMLTLDQYKLYKLIWERFVSSQMAAAVLDTVTVEIENNGYIFKTGGYIVQKQGYLALYVEDKSDDENQEPDSVNLTKLPNVKEGQILAVKDVVKEQRFTEAPARYTEASLIKFLEENGIGRPSTYAPIISIITSRDYVKREGKLLVGTPLGEVTTNFTKRYFPEIIDYEFTAQMEESLDSIARDENTIAGVISGFYFKFREELEIASKETKTKEKTVIPAEESDIVCEKCGAKMVYKKGRFGKFLACGNFPACKNTKALGKDGKPVSTEEKKPEFAGFKCEICGGEMVVRNGRYGSFYACANYPTCKFTKQKVVDLGVSCPRCSSKIVARHGKGKMLFYSCEKYPECDFSSWDMPLAEKCPDCGNGLFYRKSRKNVICKNPSCDYKREEEMTVIE